MAEYTAVAAQQVAAGQNILFTDTPVCGGRVIDHREGSGLITLRGITAGQCRARYRITFGGNAAVPADGTAGPISLAIAADGEAVQSTLMIVTPAAVSEFFNVSASIFVDVPAGCCMQISVKNTSDQAVTVQNANLIVERAA